MAQRTLVDGVGRRGNIQQQAASLPDDFRDGIAIVELLGPETFVVPGIFADGDAELLGLKRKHVLGVRGLEVARLVEDVVGGQQHFALLEKNFSLGDERGGVRHGLAGGVHGVADEADERWQRDFFGEADEFLLVALGERWALDEVLRRVAADAEFGKDGEIGAAFLGFGGEFEDAGDVAVEIADGRVELGEGDFHGRVRVAVIVACIPSAAKAAWR